MARGELCKETEINTDHTYTPAGNKQCLMPDGKETSPKRSTEPLCRRTGYIFTPAQAATCTSNATGRPAGSPTSKKACEETPQSTSSWLEETGNTYTAAKPATCTGQPSVAGDDSKPDISSKAHCESTGHHWKAASQEKCTNKLGQSWKVDTKVS